MKNEERSGVDLNEVLFIYHLSHEPEICDAFIL